jgi:signal peptidase I
MALGRNTLRMAAKGLGTALLSLVMAVVLFHFVFQPFQVAGLSMSPTLEDRDFLLVDRVFYRGRGLRRGDLAVLYNPRAGAFIVKRVVGIPGDVVSARDGRLLLNGAPLPLAPACPDFGPVAVPGGCLFVLGDNPALSQDSRSFGPVGLSEVRGRVLLRYLPPERMGPVSEFDFRRSR